MAQAPFTIKANYAYTARSDNEANLLPNQTYTVLQTDGGANVWWNIKDHTGKVGWIPANYATIATEAAPTPVQPAPQVTQPVQPVAQTSPVTQTQPAANPFKTQTQPQSQTTHTPAAQQPAHTQPAAGNQPAHGTAPRGQAMTQVCES